MTEKCEKDHTWEESSSLKLTDGTAATLNLCRYLREVHTSAKATVSNLKEECVPLGGRLGLFLDEYPGKRRNRCRETAVINGHHDLKIALCIL